MLSTKDYGLKFELMKYLKKWVLKALSDCASNKETRISIFGYIIYYCGIPMAWRSNRMKSVVLSTTEAEYMALSEVVKELKFTVQLLESNECCGRIAHYSTCGQCWSNLVIKHSDSAKHIYIRTSFVKEYQEDGKIMVKFVKSEDNEVNIFTKNTTNAIFQNHQKKLVSDMGEGNMEGSQELTQNEIQQEG